MKYKTHKSKSAATLSGLVMFSWVLTGGTSKPVEPPPQAILVLGGAPIREKFAAQFAKKHPNLPIWVSSGSPEEYSNHVFDKAGIPRSRIHLDYRAVDTVTNFTTLVDDLQAKNIRSLYLVTSDYHMTRASMIGNIVLGSRGIKIYPIVIPSQSEPEAIEKSVRDGLRSVVWMFTGSTLNH